MSKPKVIELRHGKINPMGIDDPMGFSFKYLDEATPMFCFQNLDLERMRTLFQRMKAISGMSLSKLNREQGKKPLRWHPIRWHETSEPDGFIHIRNKELWSECAYQFALSTETGRIHGFVTGNIFNVVWFDPGHKLYP